MLFCTPPRCQQGWVPLAVPLGAAACSLMRRLKKNVVVKPISGSYFSFLWWVAAPQLFAAAAQWSPESSRGCGCYPSGRYSCKVPAPGMGRALYATRFLEATSPSFAPSFVPGCRQGWREDSPAATWRLQPGRLLRTSIRIMYSII